MAIKKVIGRIVLLAVIAGIAFGIAAIVRSNQENALRTKAANLCRQGQYEESMAIFARFNDENAVYWITRCRQGIAERDARELMESGKPGEAVAILKQDHPESSLLPEAALAQAQELTAQGEPEAAKALLESVPETKDIKNYMPYCELAVEVKRFRTFLAAGSIQEAQSSYKTIAGMKQATQEELEAYRHELAKAKASDALAKGEYDSAFEQYEFLEDDAGMAFALDAMEAAGEYDSAFQCAAGMAVPDIARLDVLYGRLSETGFSPVTQSGTLEYGSAKIDQLLSRLLKTESDDAKALAAKIMDSAAENCRALIAEGRPSAAWYALGSLSNAAGGLWTEEMQALMNSCTEEMPESGIFRDTGLKARTGATITVYNESKSGLLFGLRQGMENSIYVFVRPRSHYTFTVKAGVYSPSVSTGPVWFGKEGFGIKAAWSDVKVNNGVKTMKQGDRLEGSYSITVK